MIRLFSLFLFLFSLLFSHFSFSATYQYNYYIAGFSSPYSHSITCPDGAMAYHPYAGKYATCGACPEGQVANPYLPQCQPPCPNEPEPPNTIPGVSVQVASAAICVAGCVDQYIKYSGLNESGFTVTEVTHRKTGAMCGVGDSTPPDVDPPACEAPKVVLPDGTCALPDPECPSWQQLENHVCVDKPCPDGKTLKCGFVNGSQVCSCAGPSDCDPGYSKNAFGNCILDTAPCPSGQVKNPTTGVCEVLKPVCPTGTHTEGLICVADATPPPPQDPNGDHDGDGTFNSADPDADNDNDGKPNRQDPTFDNDGDGTPNKDDPDFDPDNDGISNAVDTDRDGDGVPNNVDLTPDGPGSVNPDTRTTKPVDPTGDLDGDGVLNSVDPDRDGDGSPNGSDATPDGSSDRNGDGSPDGQCNPAVETCGDGSPGAPAPITDPLYETRERQFSEVWSAFISRVQSASIVTAGSAFFTASVSGGSCPVWEISATSFSPAVSVTLQCSSQIQAALSMAGWLVLAVAAWVAFRIALL